VALRRSSFAGQSVAEAALSAHRLGADPASGEAVVERVDDVAAGRRRPWDVSNPSYYVSTGALTVTDARGMRRWRTHPYLVLARLAADPVACLGLPDECVVIMGSHVRS
jgi:K+ transporter